MSSLYTDSFNSTPVQPGFIGYAPLTMSVNTVLYWPQLNSDAQIVAAKVMNVTATVGGLSLALPPANQATLGSDILINNVGSNSFTLTDSQGNFIATVGTGVVKYLYTTDNSTAAGSWQVFTFGTGTSSADATLLAGAGLIATGGKIAQGTVLGEYTSAPTINAAARAQMFVVTAGTFSIPLPGANFSDNTFFFMLKNAGGGSVTVTPNGSDTVDGAASLVLAPGDACIIHTDGINGWYSLGLGRNVVFAFTNLVKNVAGGADVTLTSAECANKIMTFTGALTANINVKVTNTASVYYVFNNTSGAYSLTVEPVTGAGVAVAQGTRDILVCDSANVYRAVTNTVAVTAFPPGSASAPSVTFTGNTSTGLYSAGTNQLGLTAGGIIQALLGNGANEIRGGTVAGNTLKLRGYNATSLAYVDMLTITAVAGAPTMDLITSTTIGGAYVYRAGGTAVAAADGGTGNSSYAVGDILYASGTTALSRLADVATGNVLLSGGVTTAPAYGKVGLTTHVSGTLPIANGGTGQTTANAALNALLPSQTGNAGNALVTDGTNTSWASAAAPTGVVIDFAGTTAPSGWLLCYGQAISRATYAALFAIVSTTYGAGDGSTTFNLPDLRGRASFGKDDMGGSAASRVTSGVSGITGTTLGAVGGTQAMQQHNHAVTDGGHSHGSATTPTTATQISNLVPTLTQGASAFNTDAATTGISIQNTGTGTSQNMPPAMMLNKIIKT